MPEGRPLRLPARFETASEAATEAAGEALAHLLGPGDVVALVGPLGAGKTCFARGLARGLGASNPVASPTFALVREYRGRLPVRHVDLYRLEPAEIDELDWRDLFYGPGLAVVEWADKARKYLPERHLLVALAPDPGGDPSRRVITISAREPAAAAPAGAGAPARPGLPAGEPGTVGGVAGQPKAVVTIPAPGLGGGPSRVLAIETSTRARSLAALNGQMIFELYWPPEESELQAEDLAASIRDLLKQAGLRPADIELLAVALGPGSFTGVKVGLASAKALAYALGRPLRGVGTLDVLGAAALGLGAAGAMPTAAPAALSLLDAKRGEVFGAAYLASADPLPAGREGGPYLTGPESEVVADLAAALERAGVSTGGDDARLALTGDWASRLSPESLAVLSKRWRLERPGSERRHPRASDLLVLACRRGKAGDDPFSLQPLYLRGPGVAEPPSGACADGGGLR